MSAEFIKSLCALDSLKVSISGARGIFGYDLNLNDIIKFCQNFSLLVKSKKCAVAQDTRPSSKIVSEIAIASLMERGIDVYNLGIAPTPVAFRESRKYGSGVIITSSHNPLEWNGLKFIIDGRGINEKELKIIIGFSRTGGLLRIGCYSGRDYQERIDMYRRLFSAIAG